MTQSKLRVGFRISQEDRRLLDEVCKARGEDLSGFIRRSVRRELAKLGYYEEEVRKALGVKEGG